MYSISRKLFMDIVSVIEQELPTTFEKAETICQKIEEEVNSLTPDRPAVENLTSTFVNNNAVEKETQKEKVPSETKEERMARFKQLEKMGMGQVDKNGNFTPFWKAMNLSKDMKERW